MAEFVTAAHRSIFTAQGLATMGIDPEWDRRVAAFLSWEARTNLQEEYGDIAQRCEVIGIDRMMLESQYGKAWHQHPEAQGELARIRNSETVENEKIDERYYRPFWQSQRDLVLTPAPALAAALFKATVAQVHEVWNDNAFDGDCAAIVEAELAQFCGETV